MKTITITDEGLVTFTATINEAQEVSIMAALAPVLEPAPTVRPPAPNVLADSYQQSGGEYQGLTRHIVSIPVMEQEAGVAYEAIATAPGEAAVNLGVPPWGTSFDFYHIIGGVEVKIRAFTTGGELWSDM